MKMPGIGNMGDFQWKKGGGSLRGGLPPLRKSNAFALQKLFLDFVLYCIIFPIFISRRWGARPPHRAEGRWAVRTSRRTPRRSSAYLVLANCIRLRYARARARCAHTRTRQLRTLVVGTGGGAKDEDASGGVGSDA